MVDTVKISNLKREKSQLREEILKKRDSLNADDIRSNSLKIKERFFGLKEFKNAKNVMIFVSFRSEVMTDFMIKEALALGKKIIVPLAEKRSRALKIFHINDFNDDLAIGAYGILEPKSMECKRADKKDIDIVVIPGAVFALNGNRLGFGAGYYDRFLATINNKTLKIGFAFELQIAPNVPTDQKDIKMDMIITENRVIHCKEND